MAKQTFTTGQVLTAAQMTSLQQTAMGGGSTTAKTASYVLVAADAGTVVQMNSASATTITVNTALFAAGDTVQIQNVGAGVCTVTAGTATVSTSAVLALKQYDAGSLYFNTTSAALFFAADAADTTSPLTTKGDIYTFSTTNDRLGVGTNNQILVADSTASTGLKWATPGGSQTLLTTTSLSGTSTTISSISGSYRALYIYGANIQTTSGDAVLRLRWNGFTNGYYGNAAIAGAYSTYQSVRFGNAGGIQDDAAARASITASGNCQFYINFPEYTATGFKLGTGWFNPSYNEDVMTFAVLNDGSSAAVTSFAVTTVAGTASLTGTIKVYGVN